MAVTIDVDEVRQVLVVRCPVHDDTFTVALAERTTSRAWFDFVKRHRDCEPPSVITLPEQRSHTHE